MLQKLKQTIMLIWQNITIEPVVFLYLTSVGLVSVIRPNLLIDKACKIKLNITEEICDNLTNSTYEEYLDQVMIFQSNIFLDYVILSG